MNIGDRIRQLRIMCELTQEEVGKRLDVSKATINRYETGEIDIKRTTAIKLGEVFNVSPSYIMGWTDKMNISAPEPPILKIYNSLNATGKAKADEYIKDLSEQAKYTSNIHAPSIADELIPHFEQITATNQK